jgi:hypothetical protein
LETYVFNMNKSSFGTALAAGLLAACLSACNKSSGPSASNPHEYPVNETVAADLKAKGAPEDVARFFAAAKLEAENPDPNTFIYHLFYPNGAEREVTMKFTSNQKHSLTSEEIAKDSAGGPSIYAFTYANTLGPEYKGRMDLSWFIPDTGMPDTLRQSLKKPSSTVTPPVASGFGVAWGEIATSGADVAIESIIKNYADKGQLPGELGVIYQLGSSALAVNGALKLSDETGKWLDELDALEKCARNPTNQVAKSDPDYIKNTAAKVGAARSELKDVNGMRFLNQATEALADLTPVSKVVGVALKQGFAWSEHTLGDYSENTIMREARLAVVKCEDPGPVDGNVNVVWECNYTEGGGGTHHEVASIVSNVKWVWSTQEMLYVSRGTYKYNYTETSTGTKTCVTTMKSEGSIDGKGRLTLIDDPTARQVLGYGYLGGGDVEAQVPASENCTGNSWVGPITIKWLPDIRGFPAAGGSIEGTRTEPTCIGIDGPGGTEVTTYNFSLPPKE